MFDQIKNLAGDTDTIASMAGAIWGAFNGASNLDQDKTKNIEGYDKVVALSKELFKRYANT